jgi:hypothetical protein
VAKLRATVDLLRQMGQINFANQYCLGYQLMYGVLVWEVELYDAVQMRNAI